MKYIKGAARELNGLTDKFYGSEMLLKTSYFSG